MADGAHAPLKSQSSKPIPGTDGAPDAQISKVWAGLAMEAFTDVDKFEFKAPDGCTPQGKARLIASTLLINQLFFESERPKDEEV